MSINNIRKSQIIAYLFLLGATVLEITLFSTIFGVTLLSAKMIGVVITTALFNITIWCLAIRYHRTKRRCKPT